MDYNIAKEMLVAGGDTTDNSITFPYLHTSSIPFLICYETDAFIIKWAKYIQVSSDYVYQLSISADASYVVVQLLQNIIILDA